MNGMSDDTWLNLSGDDEELLKRPPAPSMFGYNVKIGPIRADLRPMNTWLMLTLRRAMCQLCLRKFKRWEPLPAHHVCAECIARAPKCEYCSASAGVAPTSSRTLFYTDKVGWESPNRLVFLCPSCTEEHHSNWDDQWNEYYAACR